MKRCFGIAVSVAVLAWATAAQAQVSITGVIAGTVIDSTDAVLPGATVSLLDEGTGTQKTAVTNEDGAFAFRDLNFGTYQVTVKLQGFQSAVYNKVIVEVGTHDRPSRAPGGRRLEREHHGRGQNAGARNDIQRHFEHAEQQGRERASARRPQCVCARPSRAWRRGAAGHRQHALQRHAGRHDQSDDRRRQQLLERIQERRHELLRHRAGQTRRGRAGHGRDGRPRRRRRRHRRRQPEVRHAPRHEPVHGQLLRAVPHGQAQREHVRQRAPAACRRTSCAATTSAATSAARSSERPLATSCSCSRTTRWNTFRRSQNQTNTHPHRGSAAGHLPVHDGGRRGADGQRLPAGRPPPDSSRLPTRRSLPLLAQQASARAVRQRRAGHQPPHRDPEWLEPQKQINYYPTVRLDYQIKPNLSFMTSYNRYNQDAQGRRVWPIPGFPINSRHVRLGLVGVVDGHELDDQLQHAQRGAVRHPAQRRHERSAAAQAEFFELNGIVNGQAARFVLPLVSLLVADNAPVIGQHYITTITDTLTMVKGNHTFKFGGNFRDTQWRDRALARLGNGRLSRPAPVQPRHCDRGSGRERLHGRDDAGSSQRGPDGGAVAVRAAHRPRDGSADRRRRRSGHAAVPVVDLPRELDVRAVRAACSCRTCGG